jgi:integrase
MARPKRSETRYYVKQHKNGVWYIYPERISTGTKHREIANQRLDQYIAGTKSPRKKDSILIADILKFYQDKHIENVTSKDSLKCSVMGINRYLGNLEPDHLTESVLEDYAHRRKIDGYKSGKSIKTVSNGTIIREIGVLRSALKCAKTNKLIDYIPEVPLPVKTPPPRHKWIKKNEASNILQECEHLHLKLYFMLALYTAARRGAILSLTWDYIDLEHNIIDYGKGTGNKRRPVVPIHPNLKSELIEARKISISNYVIEYNGLPIKSIRTSFYQACKRAGVNGVTPHVLRHTSATWMALDGVPMSRIAQFLNITEEVARKYYAKFHPDYMRDEVMSLSF